MRTNLASVQTSVAHLTTAVSELRADQRALGCRIDHGLVVLAGIVIASDLGLAALLAKGFHWL